MKHHFSRLIAEAIQAEEIIVPRDGVLLVRLVPVTPPPKPQLLGLFRGQIQLSEDFEEPLEEFEPYR